MRDFKTIISDNARLFNRLNNVQSNVETVQSLRVNSRRHRMSRQSSAKSTCSRRSSSSKQFNRSIQQSVTKGKPLSPSARTQRGQRSQQKMNILSRSVSPKASHVRNVIKLSNSKEEGLISAARSNRTNSRDHLKSSEGLKHAIYNQFQQLLIKGEFYKVKTLPPLQRQNRSIAQQQMASHQKTVEKL